MIGAGRAWRTRGGELLSNPLELRATDEVAGSLLGRQSLEMGASLPGAHD